MSSFAISSRQYLNISRAINRSGCTSIMTPKYHEVFSSTDTRVKDIVKPFTTMKHVHKASDGTVKNSLSLKNIHHKLEINSLPLKHSGASNVLLSTISFNCLITKANGEEVRDFITFDLKIPGVNQDNNSVFSYDALLKAYGSKKGLYNALIIFTCMEDQKLTLETILMDTSQTMIIQRPNMINTFVIQNNYW